MEKEHYTKETKNIFLFLMKNISKKNRILGERENKRLYLFYLEKKFSAIYQHMEDGAFCLCLEAFFNAKPSPFSNLNLPPAYCGQSDNIRD